MVISALLCAIGLIIPMFFPRLTIPPMTFTLASHVPIMLAIFINPAVAVIVNIATTIGFFFTANNIVVSMRALSHLGFVIVASLILKKKPDMLQKLSTSFILCAVIALVHAFFETLVVTLFYFGGALPETWHMNSFLYSVILLVGVGTIAHSTVDYTISVVVWKALERIVKIPVVASLRKKKTNSN
jgi:niacin transporter